MEVVDIMEDRRVFMVLDEGCNRTCHGEAWVGNARTKLMMHGRSIDPPIGTEKRYAGLGTTTPKGRTAIPLALRLSNGVVMQGVINSNEIAEADALPLCFSLPAQMTLGLVKRTWSGRAYVPDCEGELQLFEV